MNSVSTTIVLDALQNYENIDIPPSPKLSNDIDTVSESIISQPFVKPLTQQKKINSTKLGGITVISLQKGDTMPEALESSGISKGKAHLISTAISKKYKLSNLKIDDVMRIKGSHDNLNIIVSDKVEIVVKLVQNKYDVLVRKLKDLNNTAEPQKTKHKNRSVEKIKLSGNGIAGIVKNTAITREVKNDLLSIAKLLEIDSKKATVEVFIDKVSSRHNKLLYAILTTNSGQIKVYKYKDRLGNTKYVKQNGEILSREIQAINTKFFRIPYPIHNPVIGSGFGMRMHPIIGRHRMHKGIDIKARKGTPIYSPADGVIIDMTHSRGYGKHLRIRHNSSYTTLYAHLDNFAKSKSTGARVTKGEIIGYVGRTGMASGDHLHFEVHENGRPINPASIIENNKQQKTHTVSKLHGKHLLAFINHQKEIDRMIRDQ